jgi:hypothetical protein
MGSYLLIGIWKSTTASVEKAIGVALEMSLMTFPKTSIISPEFTYRAVIMQVSLVDTTGFWADRKFCGLRLSSVGAGLP